MNITKPLWVLVPVLHHSHKEDIHFSPVLFGISLTSVGFSVPLRSLATSPIALSLSFGFWYVSVKLKRDVRSCNGK